MNKANIFILKALRKTYEKLVGHPKISKPNCIQDPDVASELLYNLLMQDKPCMISRLGSNELNALVNYNGINNKNWKYIDYIKGEIPPWWWHDGILNNLTNVAGFYPIKTCYVERFCELMLQDIKEIDILGSWLGDEVIFPELNSVNKVHLRLLEPFWSKNKWTKVLEGKRILVVHPFARTILNQYKRREKLFSDLSTIPTFKSIQVIQTVTSFGGISTNFGDWFEALEFMKQQIDSCEYDICLIGAGAYGLPLAAHVKRMGKKAVHLGGALQLLFGIKGKRWEDPNYGVKEWGIPKDAYTSLINDYWVRPMKDETPENATKVEGACYW